VLEAVTVDEFDVVQRGAHRRKVAIYDALNAVECPDYFFNVETIGTPGTSVPVRTLRHHVREFIAQLQYDDVRSVMSDGGLQHAPCMTYEHDGCLITISVIPVKPEQRGSVDHRPVGVT
jgi:hypothetical protein